MTLQEKELLNRFLEQLKGAQAGQKDAEAEALIKDACARQPDASYLLAQRALQLEQLLQVSQTQVQKLQTELDQARPGAGGGFLNDPNAWGSKPSAPAQQNPGAQRIPGTGAAPLGQPPMAAAAGAAPPARAGSWGSGLFGNIAATAAGVVAGSFLFQGIQGLMNRGETNTASSTENAPEQYATANEPELLNSYDTEPESDTLASGFDDSTDFG